MSELCEAVMQYIQARISRYELQMALSEGYRKELFFSLIEELEDLQNHVRQLVEQRNPD